MIGAFKPSAIAHDAARRMREGPAGPTWLGPFALLSIAEALDAAAARGDVGPAGWIAAVDAKPPTPAPAPVIDLGQAIDRHRELIRKLYRMQEAWRPHTIAPRLVECGRVRVDSAVDLERVGDRDRGASSIHFRGLKTCRTKACAVCFQRRKARHNAEASAVIDAWQKARGTDPLFNTLTVKHAWSDSLATTGRGIRECFRLLQQDRRWRKTRARFGIEYVCTMEITHGQAGFHPHLHVCFLPRVGVGRRELSRMARRLFKAWRRIVIREIGEAYAPDRKGFDLRRAKNPGEYMTKLGLELTDPTLAKEGRHGGRSMMQVLGELTIEGADRDRLIFAEYERETRKQRDLTYSGGLRESRAQIAKDQKAARKGVARDLVARLPYDVWDRVQHRRRLASDSAFAEAERLGNEYRALRRANDPVCETLAADRDRWVREACECGGRSRCACPMPEPAAVASADLDRLLAALAEARRLWLAARERALHDPRAELREHAAINLDAVCRLLDLWFPGTDTSDRVRDWTREERERREIEAAGGVPPPRLWAGPDVGDQSQLGLGFGP